MSKDSISQQLESVTPDYYGYGRDVLHAHTERLGGIATLQCFQRYDDDGYVDIAATLAASVLPVKRSALENGGHLMLSAEPERKLYVSLPNRMTPLAEAFIWGHEIGHYTLLHARTRPPFKDHPLLQKDPYKRDAEVEAFCDYFAGRLLGYDYPAWLEI